HRTYPLSLHDALPISRGFLEAGRGDERIGRERRLGDAQKQRPAGSGTAAALDGFVVLLAEAEFIHLLFEEEVGIADVFDLDPAQDRKSTRLNSSHVSI